MARPPGPPLDDTIDDLLTVDLGREDGHTSVWIADAARSPSLSSPAACIAARICAAPLAPTLRTMTLGNQRLRSCIRIGRVDIASRVDDDAGQLAEVCRRRDETALVS